MPVDAPLSNIIIQILKTRPVDKPAQINSEISCMILDRGFEIGKREKILGSSISIGIENNAVVRLKSHILLNFNNS